jgi:hypothetical protein
MNRPGFHAGDDVPWGNPDLGMNPDLDTNQPGAARLLIAYDR